MRLPNLSHLYLFVDYFDEQDMRTLGGLPLLRDLEVNADSIKEVVFSTRTDASGDDCCLFPKLRRCRLQIEMVPFRLPNGNSDGVSFCMSDVDASMLLGSQGKDRIAGVVPILMMFPCFQQLRFLVHVQKLIRDNDNCASLASECHGINLLPWCLCCGGGGSGGGAAARS